MKLATAIDKFLLAKKADGVTENSLKWYVSNLMQYLDACGNVELEVITTDALRHHIVDLREQDTRYIDAPQKPEQKGGLSDSSIEARKRALHSFFAWCAGEFDIQNPMNGIKRRRHKPKPKAMHPGDFVKLFNATQDTPSGTRDRAILAFIADTGCRRQGAITLKLSNLYLKERQAVVYEKGSAGRMVHFTHMTHRFLAQWLEVRPSQSETVFTSMNTGHALSESGINQILKRLKKRSGVTGRTNPHAMRHQFARQYIMNGGDIGTLARLLGHSDIRTTADYYAIFTQDELAELHNRYSPMNGLDL